jgi:hypothetical protein
MERPGLGRYPHWAIGRKIVRLAYIQWRGGACYLFSVWVDTFFQCGLTLFPPTANIGKLFRLRAVA